MSARDDYPNLASMADGRSTHTFSWIREQLTDALDEIDRLRAAAADNLARSVQAMDSDPGASVVGSPETSSEAARLIIPAAGSIRRRVLYQIWLRVDQKMSDEMLEREMRMKHQTLSSARNWLVRQGFLVDSRLRVESASGRKAVLWTLTEDGKRLAADLASKEHD